MPKIQEKAAPVEVANEHIFPASQLTPLAIKWKRLNSAGRHKEAMLVLEQIIIGSTAMFERLAQFEDFHYTVDLPILVSAAQEKVIKWLSAWQPNKGKLFSWFSLHADTLITLEDGTSRKIAELVRERYAGKVLCWNTETEQFEARHVTDWSEEPCVRKDWRKLVIKRPSGYSKPVYITHEHRVWTDSGWKQVDQLRPADKLFLNKPTLTQKGQKVFVSDRIEEIEHHSRAAAGCSAWNMRKRFKVYSEKGTYKTYLPSTESFKFKYDLTVEGIHNFFAGSCKLLVSNSKCSKNAFRSELVKVNQFRKRYHVTGDNLEKFYGSEDHEVDKHDLAKDMRVRLSELTCRWGDPQEIGAIRYLTSCIIDDDDHDKQAAIRSAAYAYCISFDLAKFFYNWSLVNLRSAFYERVYVPFTEHDLLLTNQSYTFWPEVVNIVGLDKARELSGVLGGQRVKFPTLQHIAKLRDNYRLACDVQHSDLDPDAIAEVARKHKKTVRSAQEIFTEMVEQVDPKRYGEHSIFDSNTTEQ